MVGGICAGGYENARPTVFRRQLRGCSSNIGRSGATARPEANDMLGEVSRVPSTRHCSRRVSIPIWHKSSWGSRCWRRFRICWYRLCKVSADTTMDCRVSGKRARDSTIRGRWLVWHWSTLDWVRAAGCAWGNVLRRCGGAINALIAERSIFLAQFGSFFHVNGGRLKAFRCRPRRLATLPDVPTMNEEDPHNSVNWRDCSCRRNSPAPVSGNFYSATGSRSHSVPQVQAAFLKGGIPMTLSKSPEEFQGFVEEESKRWARLIKENDIRLD